MTRPRGDAKAKGHGAWALDAYGAIDLRVLGAFRIYLLSFRAPDRPEDPVVAFDLWWQTRTSPLPGGTEPGCLERHRLLTHRPPQGRIVPEAFPN